MKTSQQPSPPQSTTGPEHEEFLAPLDAASPEQVKGFVRLLAAKAAARTKA